MCAYGRHSKWDSTLRRPWSKGALLRMSGVYFHALGREKEWIFMGTTVYTDSGICGFIHWAILWLFGRMAGSAFDLTTARSENAVCVRSVDSRSVPTLRYPTTEEECFPSCLSDGRDIGLWPLWIKGQLAFSRFYSKNEEKCKQLRGRQRI